MVDTKPFVVKMVDEILYDNSASAVYEMDGVLNPLSIFNAST